MALTIRAASSADESGLVQNVLCSAGRRVAANRVAEHEAGHRHMLVAESDGRVVGTVSTGGAGHQLPASLRLFALDVGKPYRRMGVATALIAAVEARARQLRLNHVNLEVSIDNEAAIRLYEKLGFVVIDGPVAESWVRTQANGQRVSVTERMLIMQKRLEMPTGDGSIASGPPH